MKCQECKNFKPKTPVAPQETIQIGDRLESAAGDTYIYAAIGEEAYMCISLSRGTYIGSTRNNKRKISLAELNQLSEFTPLSKQYYP